MVEFLFMAKNPAGNSACGIVGELDSVYFSGVTEILASQALRDYELSSFSSRSSLKGLRLFFCGVTEIRTRDTLLGYTRFPGVPLQPLEHHSILTLREHASVGLQLQS